MDKKLIWRWLRSKAATSLHMRDLAPGIYAISGQRGGFKAAIPAPVEVGITTFSWGEIVKSPRNRRTLEPELEKIASDPNPNLVPTHDPFHDHT